jgi:seryl-tRNA synthetase
MRILFSTKRYIMAKTAPLSKITSKIAALESKSAKITQEIKALNAVVNAESKKLASAAKAPAKKPAAKKAAKKPAAKKAAAPKKPVAPKM